MISKRSSVIPTSGGSRSSDAACPRNASLHNLTSKSSLDAKAQHIHYVRVYLSLYTYVCIYTYICIYLYITLYN